MIWFREGGSRRNIILSVILKQRLIFISSVVLVLCIIISSNAFGRVERRKFVAFKQARSIGEVNCPRGSIVLVTKEDYQTVTLLIQEREYKVAKNQLEPYVKYTSYNWDAGRRAIVSKGPAGHPASIYNSFVLFLKKSFLPLIIMLGFVWAVLVLKKEMMEVGVFIRAIAGVWIAVLILFFGGCLGVIYEMNIKELPINVPISFPFHVWTWGPPRFKFIRVLYALHALIVAGFFIHFLYSLSWAFSSNVTSSFSSNVTSFKRIFSFKEGLGESVMDFFSEYKVIIFAGLVTFGILYFSGDRFVSLVQKVRLDGYHLLQSVPNEKVLPIFERTTGFLDGTAEGKNVAIKGVLYVAAGLLKGIYYIFTLIFYYLLGIPFLVFYFFELPTTFCYELGAVWLLTPIWTAIFCLLGSFYAKNLILILRYIFRVNCFSLEWCLESCLEWCLGWRSWIKSRSEPMPTKDEKKVYHSPRAGAGLSQIREPSPPTQPVDPVEEFLQMVKGAEMGSRKQRKGVKAALKTLEGLKEIVQKAGNLSGAQRDNYLNRIKHYTYELQAIKEAREMEEELKAAPTLRALELKLKEMQLKREIAKIEREIREINEKPSDRQVQLMKKLYQKSGEELEEEAIERSTKMKLKMDFSDMDSAKAIAEKMAAIKLELIKNYGEEAAEKILDEMERILIERKHGDR